VDAALLETLCLVFVAARALYFLAYVMDWASFRTLCWGVGYGTCLAIYLQIL
jgi:uncharacterized MAPEG superfamily protein